MPIRFIDLLYIVIVSLRIQVKVQAPERKCVLRRLSRRRRLSDSSQAKGRESRIRFIWQHVQHCALKVQVTNKITLPPSSNLYISGSHSTAPSGLLRGSCPFGFKGHGSMSTSYGTRNHMQPLITIYCICIPIMSWSVDKRTGGGLRKKVRSGLVM